MIWRIRGGFMSKMEQKSFEGILYKNKKIPCDSCGGTGKKGHFYRHTINQTKPYFRTCECSKCLGTGKLTKIRKYIKEGFLDNALEKLGYRKVKSVWVSFLDGAGVGYENEDGCFQLLADDTEMFIPVEEK